MPTVAENIAKNIKQTSVAEFFERNRHLLGFDSKIKALITTIKETVDNSLDACEEMVYSRKKKKQDYSLPEVIVSISENGADRYVIRVIDNGSGIIKKQIPHVFTRLLYGSKFHGRKQGRGQQGIGVSASVLYSQLSTGKATHVVSKIGPDKPAYFYDLRIDTITNRPSIVNEGEVAKFQFDHGTSIELEIEGSYLSKGEKSVYEYLRRSSIVNPHARITFITPEKKKIIFPRVTEQMPKESNSIKPHPYGIEVGQFLKMAKITKALSIKSFMMNDFSRMGATTVKDILSKAGVNPRYRPTEIKREEAEAIVKVIQKTKIMNPPTDCLSPIGESALKKSLRTDLDAEFVHTLTRSPVVYRGNPFLIEVAIAYGGSMPSDKSIDIIRFANKVPLQYNSGACAITEVIKKIDWRRYGLQQSGGTGIPVGPVMVLVHMASTWIPFTSESKAAIAHYDPIMKEMRLAIQDCARELSKYLRRKHKAKREKIKINTFIKYSKELIKPLATITENSEVVVKSIINDSLKERFGELLNGDKQEE